MTLNRNDSFVSTTSVASVTPIPIDYDISQITPYLFVTAEDSARQFPKIFSNGIACVINVANELPQIVFPPQTGIESLKYPIQDNPTFPASYYFDMVADRIAANVAFNRRTLLYCHYGRSRSVTFTLAYLMKHHQLPLQTAFALVKQRRQLALPNVGFWSQLRSYELYLRQQKSPTPGVFQNFQDSLTYGQQMANQLTNGFGQVIAQLPLGNRFPGTVQPMHRKSNFPLYRRPLRRRPSMYSHPYHLGLPLGLRPPRLF